MPFNYPTVAIGDTQHKVLADLPAALAYLAADPAGAAFLAAEPTVQAQWLVQATRILGRQSWRGEAVDLLAFPRKGIPGIDPASIPQRVEEAAIELASAVAGGYDAANQATTASGIKRQRAGSVEQEFFYSAGGGPDGRGFRFPLPIWELLKGLLAGGEVGDIAGSLSYGTCEPSIYEHGCRPLGGRGIDRDCG